MTNDSPHAHWSAYDEKLEMASWNAIHDSLARTGTVPTLTAEAVARLLELSRSAGYGDADSFVSEHGTEADPEEPEYVGALREQFESYQDGDYWNCIDRSQGLLANLAGTNGGDTVAVSVIADAQRDAYQEGRTQRIEMGTSTPGL